MEVEKKKLLWFYILLSGCLLSIAVSVGCFIAASAMKNDAYRKFTGLSLASDVEERTKSYERAIALCPDRPEAYRLLLETFGEDGRFTKEESGRFLAIYNANHQELEDDAAYGDIHAQAGSLYINAYEDNTTVRLRMALPFFEKAKQHMANDAQGKLVVDCYTSIGRYYRDYIWTTTGKEVSSEQMESLVAEISTTLQSFETNAASDMTYDRLGFSVAVCNLLYDQRDIFAVTVTENKVFTILDELYEALPSPEKLQVQGSKDMILELQSNKAMYYDMLTRAYERAGGI